MVKRGGKLPAKHISTLTVSRQGLGGSLGKYESAMQCAAIGRCIDELSAEQKSLRETLGTNKRMYIGIGGAAGLIIAIVLI